MKPSANLACVIGSLLFAGFASVLLAQGSSAKPETKVALPRFMTDIPQPIPEVLRVPHAPPTARTADCFSGFTDQNSMIQVAAKCGVPDDHRGSGISIFIYKMSDGSVVAVGTGDLKRLIYVDHFRPDGLVSLLKKAAVKDSLKPLK